MPSRRKRARYGIGSSHLSTNIWVDQLCRMQCANSNRSISCWRATTSSVKSWFVISRDMALQAGKVVFPASSGAAGGAGNHLSRCSFPWHDRWPTLSAPKTSPASRRARVRNARSFSSIEPEAVRAGGVACRSAGIGQNRPRTENASGKQENVQSRHRQVLPALEPVCRWPSRLAPGAWLTQL